MTGKAYYITTLADWQRHAPRFANSHFIVLAPPAAHPAVSSVGARQTGPPGRPPLVLADEPGGSVVPGDDAWFDANHPSAPPDATKILVLIEADEGVHLSLEDDSAFESLPHPLAQKPISDAAQAALAPHGVAPGATTFDAAETLARIHPLLKHHVF